MAAFRFCGIESELREPTQGSASKRVETVASRGPQICATSHSTHRASWLHSDDVNWQICAFFIVLRAHGLDNALILSRKSVLSLRGSTLVRGTVRNNFWRHCKFVPLYEIEPPLLSLALNFGSLGDCKLIEEISDMLIGCGWRHVRPRHIWMHTLFNLITQ